MLTARARRVAGRADALYAGQELPAFDGRPRDAASWASPKAAVVVDGAFEHSGEVGDRHVEGNASAPLRL